MYTKGKDIPHVDALSRLRFNDDETENDTKSNMMEINWSSDIVIPLHEIQRETKNDRLLVDIMRRIRTGRWSNCSEAERSYKMNRNTLTVESEVIYDREQIVIPKSLRSNAMKR